jgi:hypothetical protein
MQKMPIGGPRCRGEDNIKTELGTTELEGMHCIHVAQNRAQM